MTFILLIRAGYFTVIIDLFTNSRESHGQPGSQKRKTFCSIKFRHRCSRINDIQTHCRPLNQLTWYSGRGRPFRFGPGGGCNDYFAVRVSDKPADQEHPFGHGKIENVSALFETVLLLATSGWIIYEAIQRLFFVSVKVEASIWSFIVMGASIIIDYTRSRILYKAARKYKSQALEADALHFSTDIWSSSVVILGLIGLTIARVVPGLDWMHKADSVAALVVAVIVIYVSGELGWRTISALLDTAPRGLAERIERVAANLPGVVDAHAIRIRWAHIY